MRESSQEVPAAVDDREDRDTSLVKSVSDPVVAYDQFADGLVTGPAWDDVEDDRRC